MKNTIKMVIMFAIVTNSLQVNICQTVFTSGVLTVTATESTAGGAYKPRHITAMWIQDNTGKFVKTILAHYKNLNHRTHLNIWESATTTYGSAFNSVDVTTGATKNVYETHTCTWNGTNSANPRLLVPDGTYTIKMELTDKNSTGNVGTFTFVKGPNSVSLTPANQNGFSNINISWVPTPTAIDEVKLEKMYSIFPNPAKSYFLVKGAAFQYVELYTLTGVKILKSNLPKVNIALMQKGAYIAIVTTGDGKFSKRIIKE